MVGNDDSGPAETKMIWILRGNRGTDVSQECESPPNFLISFLTERVN